MTTMTSETVSVQKTDMILLPSELPDVENLITEDDTPVDNIFSEKQQRLLTEPLYSAWSGPGDGTPFLVFANVGLFYAVHQPPFVPDAMLSLDVRLPEDLWKKHNRSYFIWEYGKPPDVVIEVVSNRKGGEADEKKREYARIGISYYVIFDPDYQLSNDIVKGFEFTAKRQYIEMNDLKFPNVGLGMKLWKGRYEGLESTWLRWCDLDGNLILTGSELVEKECLRAEHERERAEQERERAEQEKQRAEQERERAEQEKQRAEQEKQRAEHAETELSRINDRLKELGITL